MRRTNGTPAATAILSAALAAAAAATWPAAGLAQLAPAYPSTTRPAAGAGRPAAPQPQADVPVRQVVLFSSGVGYFEHFGTVAGNGSTELRFKTAQVNDVLKSLVLQDLDKGSVAAVTYPSQEPVAKTLKSFQVDITNNPPLADLLNQLRGARVELSFGGKADDVSGGVIVGVEKRAVTPPPEGNMKPYAVETWLLNLKVGRRFRSVPLADVKDFALEDPKLEEELDRALAAVAQSRDQDKKPVTVTFRGQGERRVRLGYVVETPVWKTSYRLVLTDKAAQKDGDAKGGDAKGGPNLGGPAADKPPAATGPAVGKAALQGWAIVENQTDNDWADVQLSLVSGRPISFIQDLYHPLYIPRPVVMPNLYANLRPQTYEGGVSREEQEKLRRAGVDFTDAPDFNLQSRAKSAGGGGAGGGGGGGGLFGSAGGGEREATKTREPPPEPMDPLASVRAAASAAALGELFQYTVGNVSLPRQRSAMIPIVTDDVSAERISIYNADVLNDHPLNGVRVTNTTGKHLLQGPVTVLDAGAYAGDARLDDVPPGQSRLLSYGVDLNVVVDPAAEAPAPAKSTVRLAKIAKGVLTVTTVDEATQAYKIQNKGDAARTVIVEHPRAADWKVVEPPAAQVDETTDTVYRLRAAVGPRRTVTLNVRTRGESQSVVQLLGPNEAETVVRHLQQGTIGGPVRAALEKVAAAHAAVVDARRQIEQRKATLAEVTAEQQRLRENLKAVPPNTDYYNRLLTKLNDQETKIEQLQKESADLAKQAEARQKELEAYVGGLNVE
jgi:hypothetical protein